MTVISIGRVCGPPGYRDSLYGVSADHQVTVMSIASLRTTWVAGISKGKV